MQAGITKRNQRTSGNRVNLAFTNLVIFQNLFIYIKYQIQTSILSLEAYTHTAVCFY